MKLPSIDAIRTKVLAHKIISCIVLLLFVCALGAGGWFGWKEYQRRQTSAFALETMKRHLQPADPGALAHMVDFNALGRELAGAVAEAFPFYKAGDNQEREISHLLQLGLLEKLQAKEQTGSMFADDASERAKLEKPLQLLPGDFVTQFASHLQIRDINPASALVTTSITHPQLNQTYTLAMDMRKTPDGWKILHLLNARELAAQFRVGMLKRFNALREIVEKKNADTEKQMNEIIPIQSCSADVGTIAQGRTVLLVIHAIARNRGNVQINNFNMNTFIANKSGQILLHRFLNAAKPVAPGEDFNQRWTMELDSSDPTARTLLANAPLVCRARWQTLSMARPKVYHIEDVPNEDIPCEIPGHKHPHGFCMLPVFKN